MDSTERFVLNDLDLPLIMVNYPLTKKASQ